ncbi:MAG: outer membrane lipoprotein carrier protein LolA [Myxococcota bacterium]
MRSVRCRRAGWTALAGLVALHVASAGAEGVEATLERVMQGMAGTSGVVAEFRESKELALLSAPLDSRGVLYFVPPDRLARLTEAPSPSRLVVDGDRFFLEDATGGEALDLSSNPVAAQVVSNFIVLFNGDLEALRERYEPRFETTDAGWTLALVPRGRPLSDVVASVTLHGQGRALAKMELVETGGDKTTTWFDNVRTDVELEPATLERVFARGDRPDAR